MFVSPIIATSFIRSLSPARHSTSRALQFAYHPPHTLISHLASIPSAQTRKIHLTASVREMYWNRETSKPTTHEGEIIKEARIIALCDPEDSYNEPLYKGPLPEGAKLLAVGSTLADFDKDEVVSQNPNVMFVSHPNARQPLVELLEKFPSVEWIQSRSAGIDFIASEGECSCVISSLNKPLQIYLRCSNPYTRLVSIKGTTNKC
jgi:hypothetical protein